MKLTSEKLIHGIANLIDPYDSKDALKILHNEFQLTDDEIREMGFDYLFPEEEPEPIDMERVKTELRYYLSHSMTDDYAREIIESDEYAEFLDWIREDIEVNAWEPEGTYTSDDIRYALGRATIRLLNERKELNENL